MKFSEFSFLKIIYIIFISFFFIKCTEDNSCGQCKISSIPSGSSDDNDNPNANNQCVCDTEPCTCDKDKCRPNLYTSEDNQRCFNCEYSNIISSRPYKILSNDVCLIVDVTSTCKKLTIENNQCVENCGEGFELGEYCYKRCYPSLGLETQDTLVGESKKCKCKNYYIELIINEKQYIKCVDSCPNYFDVNTKKCVDRCNDKTNRITENNGCKDKCEDNEFLYEANEGLEKKYYCLKKCPDGMNFYDENVLFGKERVCKEHCDQYYYYTKTELGYKCSSECASHKALIDLSNNIMKCIEDSDPSNPIELNCDDSFPYKYKGSCFRECSDTKYLEDFGKKETYFYNYHNKKICSESCIENYQEGDSQIEDVKHIDQYNLTCVECQETSNKFFYISDNHCRETCKIENNNIHPHKFDTGECVLDCGNDYLLLKDESICLKKCPDSDKKYKYLNYSHCSTCNNPENPSSLKYGEGYYIKYLDESVEASIKEYWKDENDNIKCLNSCPELTGTNIDYKFHKKIDDNECMYGKSCDSIEGNTYLYSIDNPDSSVVICYKSCKDIPGDYKYEKGHSCSNNECENYFYEYSGIYKCLNEDNYLNECVSAGLLYFDKVGKECIEDCDSGQYKIPYKQTNGRVTELGKCKDERPTDGNCVYYSINDNMCYSECPYRIVKEGKGSTNSIEITETEGNCIINCPSGYPYEYEDNNGKYCLKDCEKYIELNRGLKCVEDCKSYSKYYLQGNNKCLDECPKLNNGIYYYYNENNECLISCSSQTESNAFKFALKADTSPKKCLQECPYENKYYYDNDKICLSDCNYIGINGFIKEEGKYECVQNCETSEDQEKFIIKGNICSDNCTEDEPFFAEISVGGNPIKKCTSNCEKENTILKFYKYDEDKKLYKCLSSCDSGLKEYGKACLTQCPRGLFEESNKCVSNCNNKPYYLDANGVYKCVNSCSDVIGKPYMTSYKECVAKCPQGENYIGFGNKCISSCEDPLIDGEYYRKKDIPDLSYTIYECTKECKKDEADKEMLVEGKKECVKECPEDKPYYNSYDNTCYDLCLKNPNYPFSIKQTQNEEGIEEEGGAEPVGTITTPNKCEANCPTREVYYERNKICIKKCDPGDIINDQDSSCVSKCDINSLYKYKKEKDGTFHCVESCNKYTVPDYMCYDNEEEPYNLCPETFNYIIGKECHEKCNNNQYANPIGDNDPPKEYKCQISCNAELYYNDDDKICMKDCKSGYFNIEYSKKCVKSCKDINYYSYEPNSVDDTNLIFQKNTCVTECPSDKPFKDIDFKCKEECEFEGFKYYKPEDKKCIDICDGYKNGTICLEKCPSDINIYSDENKKCVESCQNSLSGHKYYYKSDFQCIQKCNPGDYLNGYECVSTCPEENLYIYNGECIPYCKNDKKFYLDNFDKNKLCLTDCSPEYPFFTKDENDSYKCSGSCSESEYYKSNKDPNIISKECIPKCENEYKFLFKHNNTHKECFDICPINANYFVKSESDSNSNYEYECFEKCPPGHPYHKKNSFECLKSCESTFANYDDKICISNCEQGSFWIKETAQDNIEMTLCLKNCSQVDYAQFSTPDKECVPNCGDSNSLLRGNKAKHICECIGLKYNDNGKVKCFDENIKKCGQKDTLSDNYPFQINGTNECAQNCFGVLSLSEDVCDLNFICPPNSKMGITEGKIKCECLYKFYFDADNKTLCLDEGKSCPNNYNYLIPDLNKCVQDCTGYDIEFDNQCLNICPSPTRVKDQGEGKKKTCECSSYWYKESENKYICLNSDGCTVNYPYLKEGTSECVNKCDNTYNIFYNNTCLSSCGNNMEKVEINSDDPNYIISKYTCRCKNIWANGICSYNQIESCANFGDLKYLVKETKECVKSCPIYYKFYYNNECFKSCEIAKKDYGYNIKEKTGSNECICDTYWRINEKDSNLTDCLDKCDDDEIEIETTQQCVKKKEEEDFICPYEYPYYYNQKCYSKCPDGTSINTLKGNQCKCDKIWFKDGDLIICPNNIQKCPSYTHPYYISETKECVSNKQSCIDQNYKSIFNYTCYRECPYLTKYNDTIKECDCDNSINLWHKLKNQEDLRDYLVCGLEKCPDEKPYYVNGTNECIRKCGDVELYEYGGVCFKECPLFTQKNNNTYICEFSTENNDIKDLIGNVTDRIVDIYDDLPPGGLVVNSEEASLQIYGLKKDESSKNIEAIKRSNLAYIDLSGCIKKIYESNQMEGEGDSIEDIVVVKLDLKSKNKKLIVNPVEYEFINSKNGKILDASVCEKNEVVISYPITYLLKNKKKLRNLDEENADEENEEKIQKEISDKFDKGKDLNEKDKSIDTFNFNNSIYKDICIPVEVNGKDLILEDRIQNLFPNYSFCESVCTYDYTDFVGERIYCNCSIKSGIDLNRAQGVKIFQLNEEELKDNQKGPTNLPILKCISKAKISGNTAFYYCLIFIIVEIGLLLITIFYGIPSLIKKIKDKILKKKEENKIIEYNSSENDKMKENPKDIDKDIKYRTNSNINSNSNRNIKSNTRRKSKPIHVKFSNPPKNGKEGEEEEDAKNKKEEEIDNIQKIKIRSNELKDKNIIDEKNNFDIFSENQNDIEINKYLQKNEIETQMGFYYSMKKEEKLLRTKYKLSLENDKFDSIIVVLTSVFDKIYIIRILLLSGKYEILPLMFSLYLLCHMVLLTFLTFFYDIKTIGKIWQIEDYPDTNYYLLYGFCANIIVWIIYRIFCCLLNNEYKIKKMKSLENIKFEKKGQKINKLIYKIKRNMIVYFVFQFLLILFCSFYLITFCGIYIGTQGKIFQSYGIAILEIIIIKIVYGFILGILRKISIFKKIDLLYNIILIFNKYIS